MADPLKTVLRLRRVTVDDAKRALGAVLRAEDAALARAAAAEALINEEAEAAADLAAGDDAVEAFATWLPVGRARAAAARAEHEQYRSEVAMARAGLTTAMAAAEAAENLVKRRDAEHAAVTMRREQAAMDEVAARAAGGPAVSLPAGR